MPDRRSFGCAMKSRPAKGQPAEQAKPEGAERHGDREFAAQAEKRRQADAKSNRRRPS